MVTGIVSLVLGLLGTCCCLIVGVLGLAGGGGVYLGLKARREIAASPGAYSGNGEALAGVITGAIAVAIGLLALVLGLIYLVFIGGSLFWYS